MINEAQAEREAARAEFALEVERFTVLGIHAVARTRSRAGLLTDRVVAVVSAAGIAPFDAAGMDWLAGMSEASMGSLRAGVELVKRNDLDVLNRD